MVRSLSQALLRGSRKGGRFVPGFEALEVRQTPAVTASFSAATGLLQVVGDSLDNEIVVSRDQAGNIVVNNGQVAITGGIPTVANTTSISLLGLSGNDTLRFDEANGALPVGQFFGGSGNDTMLGGAANDQFFGQSGNDFIDGNKGNDIAQMGSGDDTFVWDPGDGSDAIEGQEGFDTMLFNGSGGDEVFEASNNGGRLRFTRDLGNIVMDTNDVERVELDALGGADKVTINDLTGTDVTQFDVDLEGVKNGGAGDGKADTVIINGSQNADTINVTANGAAIDVTGLAAKVSITRSEAANDKLTVNALGGNDTVNGTVGLAALTQLTLDGGAGDDILGGGDGKDTLIGGEGNDVLDGNKGDDVMLLGAGDDTGIWDPGDGSDVIEGQEGFDTMLFNGSGGDEIFEASANGDRLRFTRNLGNIVMDVDGVEKVDLRALGGADKATINDLSATDVVEFNFDLEGTKGSGIGDGKTDTVIVNGTDADDAVEILANGTSAAVVGLHTLVTLKNVEPADGLTVNTLGGADILSAATVPAGTLSLTLNAGDGNDGVFGSQGDDVIDAGAGDDLVNAGAGDDLVDGGAGDDKVFGEEGDDVLNGGAGDDLVSGGEGDDVLQGGEGDDLLDGSQGDDTFDGGPGEDFGINKNGEVFPV